MPDERSKTSDTALPPELQALARELEAITCDRWAVHPTSVGRYRSAEDSKQNYSRTLTGRMSGGQPEMQRWPLPKSIAGDAVGRKRRDTGPSVDYATLEGKVAPHLSGHVDEPPGRLTDEEWEEVARKMAPIMNKDLYVKHVTPIANDFEFTSWPDAAGDAGHE